MRNRRSVTPRAGFLAGVALMVLGLGVGIGRNFTPLIPMEGAKEPNAMWTYALCTALGVFVASVSWCLITEENDR